MSTTSLRLTPMASASSFRRSLTTSLSGARGPRRPRAARNWGRCANARWPARRARRRKTVGQQDGAAENLRAAPLLRRDQADGGAEPRGVRSAGVAGVNGGGDEDPLGMRDADERKLQQPAKALFGSEVRRVPPGDVGERANRDPEPRLGRGLAGNEKSGPRHELCASSGTRARCNRCAALPRRADRNTAPRLSCEVKPLAQAERGKDHVLGSKMFDARSITSAAAGSVRARRSVTPGVVASFAAETREIALANSCASTAPSV